MSLASILMPDDARLSALERLVDVARKVSFNDWPCLKRRAISQGGSMDCTGSGHLVADRHHVPCCMMLPSSTGELPPRSPLHLGRGAAQLVKCMDSGAVTSWPPVASAVPVCRPGQAPCDRIWGIPGATEGLHFWYPALKLALTGAGIEWAGGVEL